MDSIARSAYDEKHTFFCHKISDCTENSVKYIDGKAYRFFNVTGTSFSAYANEDTYMYTGSFHITRRISDISYTSQHQMISLLKCIPYDHFWQGSTIYMEEGDTISIRRMSQDGSPIRKYEPSRQTSWINDPVPLRAAEPGSPEWNRAQDEIWFRTTREQLKSFIAQNPSGLLC